MTVIRAGATQERCFAPDTMIRLSSHEGGRQVKVRVYTAERELHDGVSHVSYRERQAISFGNMHDALTFAELLRDLDPTRGLTVRARECFPVRSLIPPTAPRKRVILCTE